MSACGSALVSKNDIYIFARFRWACRATAAALRSLRESPSLVTRSGNIKKQLDRN